MFWSAQGQLMETFEPKILSDTPENAAERLKTLTTWTNTLNRYKDQAIGEISQALENIKSFVRLGVFEVANNEKIQNISEAVTDLDEFPFAVNTTTYTNSTYVLVAFVTRMTKVVINIKLLPESSNNDINNEPEQTMEITNDGNNSFYQLGINSNNPPQGACSKIKFKVTSIKSITPIA